MKANVIKTLAFSIIFLSPLKVLAQLPFLPPPSSAQQPFAKLIMPKTNFAPGDSLKLDLELTSDGSKEPIDLFLFVDLGIISWYMVVDPSSPKGL